MVALAQKRDTSRERIAAQEARELSPWDVHAIEVRRKMNALPDPGVKMNEYPNPPWNTIAYEWNGVYEEDSPQYRAQFRAKLAQVIGLRYSTIDRYAAIREQIARERAGVQSLGALPPARKQVQSMPATSATNAPAREPLQTENNGVVTDSGLILIKQGKPACVPFSREIRHVGDIMQLCLDHNLRAIWVLAGTRLSELATKEFIEAARGSWELARGISYTSGPAGHVPMCKFLGGWKKKDARAGAHDGRTCYVGFAEHNERWDFEEITSPLLLLAILAYLEDALGIPVLFSPSHGGKRLMQLANERERTNWTRPVMELVTIAPVVDTGSFDCTWKRPLTEQEAAQGFYLVAYDKNSMYTASCTSVLLGAGAPVYVERPQFNPKKIIPGVWHVRISGNSPFDGVTLPHPTDGVTDGWLWSYSVKLCIELGYTVEILEAWVWKEAHTTLRPWASDMWDSRSALKTDTERYPNAQARQAAYERAKNVANHAIGLLDRKPSNATWAGAYDLYRPDWNALIKDNARYWMFRRMMKFLDMGFRPVGIHADCLYYVTSDSNPESALPGFMDRAGKLGGYKVKYARAQVFPVSLIAPWFVDESMDIGSINAKLLQLDREAA